AERTARPLDVDTVARCDVGEKSDAPEPRSHFVVEVHGDARALPLERDQTRHARAVQREGDAQDGEPCEAEEPAAPPEGRHDPEADGRRPQARPAGAVERTHLEAVASR